MGAPTTEGAASPGRDAAAGADARHGAAPGRRTVTLPPEPASAERARRWLREVLAEAGREDCVDAAELACTELVTNAVLHAHTPVHVSLDVGDDVRVEVRDENPVLPASLARDTHATTGRGLGVVAAVSDAHGVTDAGPAGKTVWFTVGGGAERSEADLLAAWDLDLDAWDTGWDVAAAAEPPPTATRTVRLLGLPPALWLTARDHHATLLRELALYRAGHDVPEIDLAASDHARSLVGPPVLTVLQPMLQPDGDVPLPADHARLLLAPPTDVDVAVPPDAADAFAALRDTLDVAESLAEAGRLLAQPGLTEVVALRDWVCREVGVQLAGGEPTPWPESDEASGVGPARALRHGPVLAVPVTAGDAVRDLLRAALRDAVSDPVRLAVSESTRGVVAIDEADRLVAVSHPLAATTGWTVDELVGRRVTTLLPQRLREAGATELARHLAAVEPLRGAPLTMPLLRSDGSEVLCSVLVERASATTGRPLRLAWVDPVAPGTPAANLHIAHDPAAQAAPGPVDAGPLGSAVPGPSAFTFPPLVDHRRLFRSLRTPYMVMSPDLVVVEANDAYLATVGRTREEIVGRDVFEVFPPEPDALDETGVPRIRRSLERARDTGRPDTMPIQRYAIPDHVNGGVVERFWSLISIPVLDDEGRTILITQRAEDITDVVRGRGRDDAERDEAWRRRVEDVEADLYARAHELAAAVEAKEVAARRLSALADAALQLAAADSVDELEEVVVGRALGVLGAQGGSIVSAHPDGGWRVSASGTLEGGGRVTGMQVPHDSPWPAAVCARTGQRLMLPTRSAAEAFHPVMVEGYERSGLAGWAFVPLKVRERSFGSLGVAWVEEHTVTADELGLLEAFAAQLAQALERIQATEARRRADAATRRLSETLQRSLLTHPPQPPGLSIAVRYQPAAREAQVGGDWYDAFVTSSGATLVVVGDVTGHDRTAAALMGQVRNLLRGIAYDDHDGPAVQLARLDAAMHGLELGTMATAVLARLEQTHADREAGTWRLRWSNAGHLAPVLRSPDGEVRLLDRRTDLLLGVDHTTSRVERSLAVEPGTTLVLYTDGLVERRRGDLEENVDALVRVVRAEGAGTPEQLADAILAELGPASRDDDLALLVLTID